MKKNSKWKRFLEWFFAEENADEKDREEDETIEVRPWQVIMILVVTTIFLIWIFYPHVFSFFPTNFTEPICEQIDSKIEKNYFEQRDNIENGDFSQGLAHWSTSDGGKLFKQSKSNVSICQNDYHSLPCSMKIQTIVPSSRNYYSKEKKREIVDNPYSFKSNKFWLGILPGKKVSASLWYKGDVVTFSIQCLLKDGVWISLGKISGPSTGTWNKLEINEIVPENGRAIGIEIALNWTFPQLPPPSVLIDDVSVKAY